MVCASLVRRRTFKKLFYVVVVFLVRICPAFMDQGEDIPHNEVRNWALKFGVDLWEYGKMSTRLKELQRKYHDENIKVARKDGLLLIRDMAKEVQNMMSFKIEAVRRITESAEQAALTPQTDNGQPFRYYNAKRLNSFGPDGRPVEGTREMMLTPNPHFDHLPVNTSLSTVLIPPNVEEYDPEVINAIQWSEHLDPLFIHNYEDDPSLSWQFFGSGTGFLRRYPGIAWPPVDMSTVWQRPRSSRNVYDFRSSAWYVSAATSPKDIVILIDNSGSMSGHKSNLARATTESILNTLGDNDFVNVFKFSDITEETVPCFKDMLVQANNENVRWLKESLSTFKSENIANFTAALVTGFEILHKYNRTGQGCQCNQAIMLITDGPPSSYQEIFKMYNFPHYPVRIFTYLVGKDSSSAHEMRWMACANKGYYTRIENFDEINQKVLHYIEVLARPMVMYQTDHPIQWTPAYVGGRADSFLNDKVGQLITTVTTPVFDRRNHTVRVANLLGVVGTDVSIDQIKKLVPPYKLGVNGYSFIINNNGHVLYHPDLRPLQNNELYDETLEPQYISVDLTEVELVENENGPRENHSVLLDLRYDMIQQKEGETELGVKIHYDNVRRVTTRRHKYFYTPIEGTPFSLGLAIPERYGMYELLAEQEIKHSQRNVTDYFKGNNWKVHPDWVYCEYTSGTSGEQWFRTAEERVLHFLSRSRRPGWKWMSLRPRSPSQREHHHQTTKKDKDAYFCDKNLLQSLVLDAMVTESLERHHTRTEDDHEGHQIFGKTLTFVATRSGLLRWTDHVTPGEKAQQPHFSETNVKAMDETWYKRAVDQHSIEPESFVFSVPFDSNLQENPLITATHAVFVEHNGHRAPAAVVGIQYQHTTLASHFLNITSKCTGTTTCHKTCASEKLDCYVLDNNGFVIISERSEHTGQFFGQIDGTIMDSLVQDRIYKKITVYDYQGACSNSKSHYSGDAYQVQPFDPIKSFFKYLVKFSWLLLAKIEAAYGTAIAYAQDDEIYPEYDPNFDQFPTGEDVIGEQDPILPPPYTNTPSFIPPYESDPMEGVDMSQFGVRPCDRKVDLYVLQPDKLNVSGQSDPLKGKLTNCHVTACERPFSVQKIPHSNLILLVVDTMCPCGSKQFSITPHELIYDTGNGGCLHKPKDSLYRRRPPKCINYHPEVSRSFCLVGVTIVLLQESEINICGKASIPVANVATLLIISAMRYILAVLS
ncbi:voltage-dependent calcium channel subunit alpha-2/delta-3 isoform X2 [Tribolium castaneum]|uniref:Voltage-dependent calcium channel subunit alpha-2/delta-3-like Protein n=1 Tax=Tribolium castaneum TaxID=7070 RepID=A0A139WP66_TRICA|nr:PREDICTED: voltage-dependent calcium channel subunit alpha-2/delta-3 isoform X2 [Tribolium castaneum]KYB29565.1 Voltage-dependent calcium channel subunit alpha-2/delta-3-like Protein [Tribolium castaneum]|eukprot:XP_015834582.1 PREDICTED: voltage-dependent calcium channel subunit alpha-2/delta-3 isoform X2 [Tribolium castaneum]